MIQCVIIVPDDNGKLVKIRQLRNAGFVVSDAVEIVQETNALANAPEETDRMTAMGNNQTYPRMLDHGQKN